MKQNHFKIMIVAMLLPLFTVSNVKAVEKRFEKTFPADCKTVLKVSHRFGKLKIVPHESNSIDIVATASVGGKNSDKASRDENSVKEKQNKETQTDVDIDFKKNGNTITVTTKTGNKSGNKNNQNINIDMEIKVPQCVEAQLTNKFGNIIIPDYSGRLDINLHFGTLSAGIINNPGNIIRLKYADKSEITEVSELNLDMDFSSLIINKSDKLNIECRYSTLELLDSPNITGKSRFGKLLLQSTTDININSHYTNINIGTLAGTALLETKFGKVKVEQLKADFKHFKIMSDYTNVSVRLEESKGYRINLKSSYTDVSVPNEKQMIVKKGSKTTIVDNRGDKGIIEASLHFGAFTLK